MKKYICLILATLILTTAVLMSGYVIKNDTAEVKVFALSPENVNNTVTANGKLQYSEKQSVKTKGYGIIKEINVKNKNKVKKGDLLFSYYHLNKDMEQMLTGYYDIQSAFTALKNSSLKEQLINEVKNNAEIQQVYSEYSGTISDLSYSNDDVVTKNAEVMKISDPSSLEIPININETYIDQITTGQRVEINFTAIPQKTFQGTVVKIADEASQTNGLTGKETTICVTVKLNEQKTEKIRIGYSADCSVITSTDENVLVIPYEYIRSDDNGDYVFKVKNNFAKKVYLKTGKEYKNGTEIISGLSENDMVIKNCDDVYHGQKIKIIGE